MLQKFIGVSIKELESSLKYVESCRELRVSLLKQVKEFVFSGKFTTRYKAKAYFERPLESGKLQARRMGIKLSSLRATRSLLTKEAYRAIGEDTLIIIENGTEAELLKLMKDLSFRLNVHTLRELFDDELLGKVSECVLDAKEEYALTDCQKELFLLHYLSRFRFNELLGAVDIDKLYYLIRVIDKKAGDDKDYFNIMKFLVFDNAVHSLKDENGEEFSFPLKSD